MPRGHPHLPETESLRVEARDPPPRPTPWAQSCLLECEARVLRGDKKGLEKC